jgi:Protein of unknown function (DUF3563)
MTTPHPLREEEGFRHSRDGVNLAAIEQRARALRRADLSGILRRFAAWIDHKLDTARWRELESYLSQSTDRADLERRLREITANNGRPKFG